MQEPQAIEYVDGAKARHRGETSGGTVTIFRLRYMTAEEIESHGLQKYAEKE